MFSFGPYSEVEEGQSHNLSFKQGHFCLEQMLNPMGRQHVGCK